MYLHDFSRTTDQLDLVDLGLVRCSIFVSRLQHNVRSDLFARSIHDEQIHLNAWAFALTLVHDVRANLDEVRVPKKARAAAHHFELLGIDRPLEIWNGERLVWNWNQDNLKFKFWIGL